MNTQHTNIQRGANHSITIDTYRWGNYSHSKNTMPIEPARPATAQYDAIIKSMTAEITHLKQQQAQRLLYITNASSEGIWEWNIKTGHIYRNMALQNMVGFMLESTHDLSWWFERVHPDDKPGIEEQVNSVLSLKKQSWEMEYRFLCADNSYKSVYDRGFIIYENSQPVKMIGSLQDLTEIKELESRLTQEKLDRQKKIAEAIIQAEERERANLGHELHDNVNQVLTTARLYLDMMTPSDQQGAAIVEKTKEFIHNAINEIRSISKEMVLPNRKERSLTENIQELLDDLEVTGLYDTHFLQEGAERVTLSEGKKTALLRIVQEQLKNIIRHSGARHITIHLRMSDGQVVLSIKDDGVGFDAGKKRNGIGLLNIRNRVQLYKGEITITTAPGKGCLLDISLPADN